MNKTDNIYSTIRSAKFVLKPTVKQKEILESFFGLSRAVYNISLYNIKNSKFGTYEIQNGKNKGNIVPRIETLSLSERTYNCNECGFEIDRDLNASINILNVGLNQIVATVTTTGTTLKN